MLSTGYFHVVLSHISPLSSTSANSKATSTSASNPVRHSTFHCPPVEIQQYQAASSSFLSTCSTKTGSFWCARCTVSPSCCWYEGFSKWFWTRSGDSGPPGLRLLFEEMCREQACSSARRGWCRRSCPCLCWGTWADPGTCSARGSLAPSWTTCWSESWVSSSQDMHRWRHERLSGSTSAYCSRLLLLGCWEVFCPW